VARRQGARKGGDAPESTCAELDEKIDNFVSIHKKSSWSGMIIAAKSVYFLSTPLKSVYFLSISARSSWRLSACRAGAGCSGQYWYLDRSVA
jgi:hypothetical protein